MEPVVICRIAQTYNVILVAGRCYWLDKRIERWEYGIRGVREHTHVVRWEGLFKESGEVNMKEFDDWISIVASGMVACVVWLKPKRLGEFTGEKWRTTENPEGSKESTPGVKYMLRQESLNIWAGLYAVTMCGYTGAIGCALIANSKQR